MTMKWEMTERVVQWQNVQLVFLIVIMLHSVCRLHKKAHSMLRECGTFDATVRILCTLLSIITDNLVMFAVCI
jgi:hypothetical protein